MNSRVKPSLTLLVKSLLLNWHCVDCFTFAHSANWNSEKNCQRSQTSFQLLFMECESGKFVLDSFLKFPKTSAKKYWTFLNNGIMNKYSNWHIIRNLVFQEKEEKILRGFPYLSFCHAKLFNNFSSVFHKLEEAF